MGLCPVAFGPRIDSERVAPFLPDSPETLVSRKQFNHVPIISGLTQDEGGLFAASITIQNFKILIRIFKSNSISLALATVDGKSLEVFKKDPVNALLHLLSLEKQKNGLEITQKVYDHYFVNNKETDDIVTQYGQV